MLLLIALVIINDPVKACVKNVHITLGDYFADPQSNVFYRVGFMLEKYQDKDCLDNLKLEVEFDGSETKSYSITTHRDYKYQYDPPENGSEKDKLTNIERTFAFADIISPLNASKFKYMIKHKDKVIKGPYDFETNVATKDKPVRMISFGDHDLFNGMDIINSLKKVNYDVMVLLGDYSYDIQDDNGQRGDDYFEAMEPIMTKAPVVLILGNHDNFDESRLFGSRFIFPLTTTSASVNYYHFVIQNTLFIGLNFDMLMLNKANMKAYYEYVRKTLESYANDKTITQRIFVSHRPFMCSNSVLESLGLPVSCKTALYHFKYLDDLLMKYDVRVALSAHEHFYERLGPVFNYNIDSNHRHQLIVGSGGKDEILEVTYLDKVEYKEAELQQAYGYLECELTIDKMQCGFMGVERLKELDHFIIYSNSASTISLKQIVLLSAILLLLVIGGVLFFMMNKKSDEAKDSEISQELSEKQVGHSDE